MILRNFILVAATLIPFYQFRAPYDSPVNNLHVGTYQSGADLSCVSTNGVEMYTCKLNGAALTIYTPWMMIPFVADVSSISNPTLNIDTVGPISIKDQTGTTTPLITSGPHLLMYDGKVFRMLI